jgi:hypothetical protein
MTALREVAQPSDYPLTHTLRAHWRKLLECNIRKLRNVDLSVLDLVSQQEFLAALWIITELKR